MTIYRRNGTPYWHYDFSVGSRRFRGSTRIKSKSAAEAITEKLRMSVVVSRTASATPGRMAFDHLLKMIDGSITPKKFSIKRLWRSAQAGAEKRGLEFSLTLKELEKILARSGGCCEISGLPFDGTPPKGGGKRPWAASIDRIDSSKGYKKGNCRLVCLIVNFAMNEWGERELLLMTRAIARRQGWTIQVQDHKTRDAEMAQSGFLDLIQPIEPKKKSAKPHLSSQSRCSAKLSYAPNGGN